MPTKAIITVACQTFVMKNVDIIKHPKMTKPAVQIFLNMNGTGNDRMIYQHTPYVCVLTEAATY